MAGMFKPTPSLNSRVEARLRGWRGPAVTILRKESKRTDPFALDPPFRGAPHTEPPRALSAEQAHKMMGLPMQDILEMRGGTRRAVERDDLLQWSRARGQEKAQLGDLELGIARASQKSRPQVPYRQRLGAAEIGAVPKVNPARYKPPATNYWRHSIYAYNKETIKNLPATTANANRMIRAYFNMAPTEEYAEEIISDTTSADDAATAAAGTDNAVARHTETAGDSLPPANPAALPDDPSASGTSPADTASMSPEDRAKAIATARGLFEKTNRTNYKEHKTTALRIYVADRGYVNKGMIRQDVRGKISMRMQPKSAFHYPYRTVQDASAQITYKHWRSGVGVSVHVHRGEVDSVPSKVQQRKRA